MLRHDRNMYYAIWKHTSAHPADKTTIHPRVFHGFEIENKLESFCTFSSIGIHINWKMLSPNNHRYLFIQKNSIQFLSDNQVF